MVPPRQISLPGSFSKILYFSLYELSFFVYTVATDKTNNFEEIAAIMEDATRKFTTVDGKSEMKEILTSVYSSLVVKGYNPINQLVGYILSEDPTYITNYNNARQLICRIDRDELLQEMLKSYLDK